MEREKDDFRVAHLTLKFYLANNLRSRHGMTAAAFRLSGLCCKIRHARVLGSVIAALSPRVDKKFGTAAKYVTSSAEYANARLHYEYKKRITTWKFTARCVSPMKCIN